MKPNTRKRQVTQGAEKNRKTGIDIIGDAPWGTHFCQFYQTKQDLIDILVPYFKAGLENNEFCMWVTSEPLEVEDAKTALRRQVKNLDNYIKKGQIEILDYSEWYTKSGKFHADKVLQSWVEKEKQALIRGFEGLRLTGNTFWLEKKEWRDFADYEEEVNNVIGNYRMIAICTYSLDKCGTSEVIDVISNHQFALIKREGEWELIESSERKRAEEELIRLSNAVKTSTDSIVISDLEGKIIDVNEATLKMYGADDKKDLIGKSSLDFIVSEDREKALADIKETLERGYVKNREYHVILKDGGKLPVEMNSGIMKDANGDSIGFVGITRDITERKRAEEELRQTRDYLDNLINYANAPIIVWDPDRKITLFNRAFEHLTDKKADEVIGRPLHILFPEASRDESLALIDEAANGKYWEAVEISILREDGEVRTVLWNSANLHADDGEILVATIAQGQDITERKRAEEALRESEEKFRSLVETTSDWVWEVDPNGIYTYASPKVKDLLGFEPEEVIGKTPFDLMSPDEAEQVAGLFRNAVESRKPFERLENTNLHKDGRQVVLEASGIPILDAGGNFLGYRGIDRDITERKRAEEGLKSSEERLKILFEYAPDGIFLHDLKGNFIDGNKAAEQLIGYKREELIGKSFLKLNLLPPDQLSKVATSMSEDIPAETAGSAELTLIQKDGTKVPVEINSYQVKIKGVTVVLGIARDITERKKAEEKLREANTIINRSPAVAFTWKNQERWPVEFVSENVEKLFGYTAEEFMSGKVSYADCVHPDDLERVAGEVGAFSCEEGRREFVHQPYRIKTKDGLEKVLYDWTFIVRDENGKITHYKGIVQDITERKKMEAQLIQAERLTAVGTLAYGIAHEFNNILAGILGNAEFGMENDNTEEKRECFHIIMESCDRARSITNSLLTLSGQRETRGLRADVTDAVQTVLGLVERELEKQNIKVVKKFNPVPEIVCDPGELSEVCLNMITNARDAMTPKGGTLAIETRKRGDNIEIIFTDTGCGIPDSIKGRIFEPFVTTKGALGQSETPGTGLGLFLSYGIINRYRGEIKVKSEKGQGSKFTIKIPISKNQVSPVLVETDEEKRIDVPQNLNILLIDDEEPICNVVKKFLETEGHTVVTSLSGKKGINLFKNKTFDLVLSDITMPDMDGVEFISKVKRADRKVKIIVLTGHLAEEQLNRAKEAGADQILLKPFKQENLYKTIGKALSI